MSTDPTPDPVAARLAEIRERSERPLPNIGALPISNDAVRFLMGSAADVPALLGALEAVLALHQPGRVLILGKLCRKHEAHRHFSITGTEADAVRSCPDCAATVLTSCTGCGAGVSFDQCPDRAAISAELLRGTTDV